jgi:multidrug efflux pump subunit AcrB
LLKNEHQQEDAHELRSPHRNWFLRIHDGFNRGFEKLRSFYAARLEWVLNHPRLVIGAMLSVVVLSLVLVMKAKIRSEPPLQRALRDYGPS